MALENRLLFLLLAMFFDFSASQKINIMILNEERNWEASDSFRAAQEYFKQTPTLGVEIGNLMNVTGNTTDAKTFLEMMCTEYNNSIAEKNPPHIVLDFTMSSVPSETAKSFTAALGLPTISTSFGQEGDLRQWRTLDEREKKYLIQIMPPADIIPEVIRSIVVSQNITNAGILFDDSIVMDHKYKSLLQNIPTRHMIVKVDQQGPRAQLERMRSRDIFNYFIVGRMTTIKKVFDVAYKKKYFMRQFAWHGITSDSGNVYCDCKNATVFYVKPRPNQEYTDRYDLLKTKFGLSGTPEITVSFYFDIAVRTLMAAKTIMKGKPYWENYVTCNDYDEKSRPVPDVNLMKAFTEVTEKPSYGPFVLKSNGQSMMKFNMDMTLVTINNKIPVKSVEVATWEADLVKGLDIKNGDKMVENSAVTVYRIVTVVQKPFVMYDGVDDKNRTKFKGYCIDLIDEIRNITKFDYDIFEAPDGKFGNMDENGEWNGMIKELILKNADIALGSLSVMAERENVVDFTVPYYDLVGITILMKKPKAATSLFKFLTVLENDVWLCILAAYFFTSFLMWVFDRWSPYSYQNNREKYKDDEEKREFNLKECLWFCMTSLTPQGGGEAPKNLSGRLVAATWWLFGFIIIASYTANLAAFLTVSRLDTPVESLDDLAKQYKIQYAPLANSSAQTYFQRMADIESRFYEIWKDMSLNDSLTDVERAKLAVWDYPVSDKYTKIWQAMKEAKFPDSLEAAVARVMESKSSSEGFAFIGDATDIRYLVLTSCDLQMVGEEFSRKPYAIATQQGSPLKDQFNNAILQLLNKRKLEKLKEQWWNQNPEKKRNCEKQDDQTDGISIQNIGGVFIVIFVGIGLACITLAFEYWWYRFKRNPQVVDTGNVVVQPRTIPTAGGGKMDPLTMPGFRPRNTGFSERPFTQRNAALAAVNNPW
ncbi:Ionotropic receptor 25a [Blattella germanica]|uniref:Chemosensory protein n=1 Tax=Blattella germanica TaxID=6973 RepID=A0A0X8DBS6_BLAGE|nr:chemosensory protein [Blattella germanica]PSN38557.1 Ionotropic receptor 25a [Blattella germanica]